MSGWLIEGNTVIDAQMGIMVGGGRDTVVRGNNFINCDKGLHIDNRGMGGEKPDCLGSDMDGLKAAMSAPAWAKYGLSAQMSECLQPLSLTEMVAKSVELVADAGPDKASVCSPINASAIDNCFSDNLANWEVWCGTAECMNDPKWLSKSSGNVNGTCGQ